jgi:hypothetical protein
MNARNRFKAGLHCLALGSALTLPLFAAVPGLVVDRGLPQTNLNAPGEYRSNIRWSLYDSGFLGDDFTIGARGESWVIDAIRVWTVPGVNATDPEHRGDFYRDVRLYFGGAHDSVAPDDSLTPVVTGMLKPGSDQSSNPSILISDTTSAGVARYEDFGTDMRVWQIDFTRLNLDVQGGEKVRFGAFGLGRARPDNAGKTYAWFNAATNAQLASTKQDGADGTMLLFTSGGKFKSAFDGKGAGWDKSSDINVQVFAHRVDGK